jgi:hypothetical protein
VARCAPQSPVRPGSRPSARVRATAALCAARPEVCALGTARPRGTPSRASRAFAGSGRPAGPLVRPRRPHRDCTHGGFSLGDHRKSYRPVVPLVCPSRGFRSKQAHGPVYASEGALDYRRAHWTRGGVSALQAAQLEVARKWRWRTDPTQPAWAANHAAEPGRPWLEWDRAVGRCQRDGALDAPPARHRDGRRSLVADAVRPS